MTKQIQFSLAAAALIVLSGSACMKKPELVDEDGPQAEPEAVQNAVAESWGADVAPTSMLKDEFVQLNKSIAVSGNPGAITQISGITVASVTIDNAAKKKSYQLVRRLIEIGQNNEQKVSTDERPLTFNLPEGSAAAAAVKPTALHQAMLAEADLRESSPGDVNQKSMTLGIENILTLFNICVPVQGSSITITCHNLKTWESVEEVPAQLKAQEGCGGLPNCQIRMKNFAMDVILRGTDPDTGESVKEKEIYTAKIAIDAPYLSRLFSFCYQGLGTFKKADGTDQKIPLTVCDDVANFIRGTP